MPTKDELRDGFLKALREEKDPQKRADIKAHPLYIPTMYGMEPKKLQEILDTDTNSYTSPHVLVCGSREWKDESSVRRELTRLSSHTILHIGQRYGAEAIAHKVAADLGLRVEEPDPQQISKMSQVICFHHSRATALRALYCSVARDHKIPISVFDR